MSPVLECKRVTMKRRGESLAFVVLVLATTALPLVRSLHLAWRFFVTLGPYRIDVTF